MSPGHLRWPCGRLTHLGAWVVASAIGLVACAEPPSTSEGVERRNVLLILIDDLRPDLGAYGHTTVQSPNLDRLAAMGTRFDRAYTQFPVCNPSRASLLTGLRPSTLGVLDNETSYRERNPDVVTLPQLFRENGYFTASVGKVFHGAGGNRGWSEAEYWDEVTFPRGRRRAAGAERNRYTFAPGRTLGWVAAGGTDEDQADGQVPDEVLAAIDRSGEAPFFIAAGFLRPHAPMVSPKRYYDLYSPDEIRAHLPPNDDSARGPVRPGGEPLQAIDEAGRIELLRAYFACITFVDTQIGRLLDGLESRDLLDETVIVVVSDHGIHLGERGWWSKNALSEVAARVPLIVHAADFVQQPSSRDLVELIDLYPTLAELASLDDMPELPGRSFARSLVGADPSGRRAALTHVVAGDETGFSVRTDRWRYTEWSSHGQPELYDHDVDPHESTNLAALPEHRETVASLSELLRDLTAD